MVDLMIIGAGLCGLAIARRAVAQGAKVTLLDARARVGGRVLSHWTQAGAYDLGPAWIWPSIQPRVAQAARLSGLTLFEQTESGGFLFQDRAGAIHRLAHGFAQEPPSMRIQGGVEALVRAFARELPSDAILLEHAARLIKLSDHFVEVAAQTQSGVVSLKSDRVILAMPPRLIAGIQFEPSLARGFLDKLEATPGWMASQAKALAIYDRPFWREAGLSGGAISHVGPLGELHDASLPGVSEAAIFGFFAWPAQFRAQRGGHLSADVATQLGGLFGAEAAHPREIVIQDWAFESFTATPFDLNNGAEHPAYRPLALPAPWRERILLAGTEMAPEFGGYLEGALQAAEAVPLF